MRVTRRDTLVLAIGGALLPALPALAQEHAEFPFRVTHNRPWTAVSVNGKGPFPFLIDMGAGGFLIDQALATQIGLSKTGDNGRAHSAGGNIDLPVYLADEIVVGGRLREQHIYLAGLPPKLRDLVKGLMPATQFGVIGFDFDRQMISADRALGRTPAGYQQLAVANRTQEGSMSHIRSVRNVPQTVINAELDGAPIRLLVDTGASDSLFVFPAFVRAHGLWKRYAKGLAAKASTIGGVVDTREVRASSLKFGALRFDKPIITLSDPANSGDLYNEADGLLGIEILRRMNFILDPDRKAFWYKANRAFDDVYRYDRAGVQIGKVGDALRVTSVGQELPAGRAGLRPGDKVTGWAGEGGYFGLLWALEGAPGSVVRIQIERNGQPQVVDVTLEDQI